MQVLRRHPVINAGDTTLHNAPKTFKPVGAERSTGILFQFMFENDVVKVLGHGAITKIIIGNDDGTRQCHLVDK